MAEEPEPLPPGYRLGDYIIEEELAPGGMGRTYRATNTRLGVVVAVNVLARGLRGAEGRMRFNQAVRATTLRTRGLVYELAETEAIPYVVVAYANGAAAVDVSEKGKGRTTSGWT